MSEALAQRPGVRIDKNQPCAPPLSPLSAYPVHGGCRDPWYASWTTHGIPVCIDQSSCPLSLPALHARARGPPSYSALSRGSIPSLVTTFPRAWRWEGAPARPTAGRDGVAATSPPRQTALSVARARVPRLKAAAPTVLVLPRHRAAVPAGDKWGLSIGPKRHLPWSGRGRLTSPTLNRRLSCVSFPSAPRSRVTGVARAVLPRPLLPRASPAWCHPSAQSPVHLSHPRCHLLRCRRRRARQQGGHARLAGTCRVRCRVGWHTCWCDADFVLCCAPLPSSLTAASHALISTAFDPPPLSSPLTPRPRLL